MMSSDKKRLLLDSDGGVDDAGAIIMALEAHKRGEVEVMGVTAVAGNTHVDNVVRNICRVLEVTKCKVPVFRGCSDALVVSYESYRSGSSKFHGSDGFNDVDFEEEVDVGRFLDESVTAAEAIRDIVNRHPGEMTLVTLGPLTNVALAFLLDPTLPSSLKEMVMMGGSSRCIGNVTPLAEFNFHADPEAAKIVLDRCDKTDTLMLPWETCHFNRVSEEWRWEVLGKLQSEQMELMNRIEGPWKGLGRSGEMCDQRAMAVALKPDAVVAEKKRCKVSIELHGGMTRGMSAVAHPMPELPVSESEMNVSIVEEMEMGEFKRMLLQAFH